MKYSKLIMFYVSIGMYTLYAEAPSADVVNSYLEKTRKLTGDVTTSASKGKETNDKVGGHFDDFMDTVIWNDTFTNKTNKVTQVQQISTGNKDIPLDSPVDKLEMQWKIDEDRLAALKQAESNKTKEIETYYTGGYCTFDDTLSISKANEYGKLDCLMDFGDEGYKNVEVFASFYPDYKREIVIALPIYVTFENQSRATFSGIVMNGAKTSVNLAGWVDSKRMAKMLGEGLLLSNDVIYNYVSGYMQALERSRTATNITYDTTANPDTGLSTSRPIVTSNTVKPEIKDYVISAGITLVSSLVSIVGKDYLESEQPLFAVYPQRLYVEGVVSFDNKGLAQRFGNISNTMEQKSIKNNTDWLRDRNGIIQKYNNTKNQSTIIGGSL